MDNYDLNDYLGMIFADLIGIFTCLMGWKWVVNPATKESLGPVFYICIVVGLVVMSILVGLMFLAFLVMFVAWIYFSFSEILERRTLKNKAKKERAEVSKRSKGEGRQKNDI